MEIESWRPIFEPSKLKAAAALEGSKLLRMVLRLARLPVEQTLEARWELAMVSVWLCPGGSIEELDLLMLDCLLRFEGPRVMDGVSTFFPSEKGSDASG